MRTLRVGLFIACLGALGAAPCLAQAQAWPFDAARAQALQQAAAERLGVAPVRTIDLPGGLTMSLVLIPAGEFDMGAPADESPLDPDESPPARLSVAAPFWMASCEVTNQQYRLLDPAHDSRFMDTYWKDRVGPGPSLNGDTQPVVRVSWLQALSFSKWLTQTTGLPFRLPTEAEWEWACRAGTNTPWHCSADELFRYANYADATLETIKPWAPRDPDHSDGQAVTAPVGQFEPNAWGLRDMLGNVAEWTSSAYLPYPYAADDAHESPEAPGSRVVRGGSFDDRPRRARSAFRLSYLPDFRVYNVGFRVACDAG